MKPTIVKTAQKAMRKIGFLLIPNFSHLSLISLTEPLRIANRFSEEPIYQTYFITPNNQPVCASDGAIITPNCLTTECKNLNRIFVVSGFLLLEWLENKPLIELIKNLHLDGVTLSATSTGSFFLAEAGIFHQRKCTVHWELSNSFRERFPQISLTDAVYEIDEDIATCSGGIAGLDMMLVLISQQFGDEISNKISDQCIHPIRRTSTDHQQMSLLTRYRIYQPRLLRAISLMEQNIEEPLSIEEIAETACLSKRQLERLFQQHLDQTPARFYLLLRLERAKLLLEQLALPIFQIATMCGFSSSSYFIHCFKEVYSIPPTKIRKTKKLIEPPQ